jgi:predicted AAA+ superfamily ATPase
MAVLTLYPFSSAEIKNTGKNFIEELWAGNLAVKKYQRADIAEIITQATFPEISLNKDIERGVWFDSYLNTILQRDAVELAKIRKTEIIYQLLVSFTSRAGSLLKNDNVMKEIGLPNITYDKYKSFCNASFMIFEIQPWAKPNKLNKRFVKSKKLYFTDTNFLCYIMRRDIKEVYANNPSLMGHLFENFIATEIMKNISLLPGKYFISHFNPVRGDGQETDFVIEKDDGTAVAVEVKLDATITEKDFKNLELCQKTLGDNFKKGIIIYTGGDIVPFGGNLWAVPVNYLWE